MIRLQYASPFDNYAVDFWIGPLEELRDFFEDKTLFGEADRFLYSSGATLSAANHGCLIWMPHFEGTPEEMASFFHEVTHASVHRFEKNGMLQKPLSEKALEGDVSFEEMIATSVSEIGGGLLSQLKENDD